MVVLVLPREIGSEITRSLEQELGESIDIKRDDPEKVAKILYQKFKKEFERPRDHKDEKVAAEVIFAGSYFVDHAMETDEGFYDPKNPRKLVLRLQKETNIGHGCDPIPYNPDKSIIARAILTGRHQNVGNVEKDPSHWACDPGAQHEEVYPILSPEPIESGRFKGEKAVVAVHDFDFGKRYTISVDTARELERILKPYGEAMYPGSPRIIIDQTTPVYVTTAKEIKPVPGRNAETSRLEIQNPNSWRTDQKRPA